HQGDIAVLLDLAIYREADTGALRVANFRGWMNRGARRGPIEALAHIPRSAHLLGLVLQISPRQIYAQGVAVDMIQRLLEGDIRTPLADRDHEFELEVQAAGLGRIGNLPALRNHCISRLGKEKGRLTLGITTHFMGVRHIVSPHAVDASNREKLRTTNDW